MAGARGFTLRRGVPHALPSTLSRIVGCRAIFLMDVGLYTGIMFDSGSTTVHEPGSDQKGSMVGL